MKSKLYLISLAALLAACSSPETDDASSELTETVQDVVAVEMLEPATEAAQMENSTEDVTADAEIRQVDAHVHGGATLAIAVDGKNVTAELETPLYNLLGFEHEPETDDQKAAVEKAEKQLSQPEGLISFNNEAGCKAMPVMKMAELFEHDEDHDHHHDEEHHEDHDNKKHHEGDDHDHHDEDKDHDHDDHKNHEDHEEHSEHKDVVLTYSFTCDAPQNLTRLTAELLAAFPLMDELDVVYLGANSQTTFELTPSTPTADLRP